MKIDFLNLKKINETIEEDIKNAINQIIDSGWYILGKSLNEFEVNLKEYLVDKDSGFITGCNSGTDALKLALLCSDIVCGDEVITVSCTAIPTVTAITSLFATPVFVDIDPSTWVMDIDLIPDKITDKTKAVIVVHLYGNMADVYRLKHLLKEIGREDIIIIEDVAQAHGSKLNDRQAGTIGDYGAFSFYPTKNIGALGDGGAIFCDSISNDKKLKMLRNYGQESIYITEIENALNSRLDEVQASILSKKLIYLDKWNKYKECLFNRYRDNFAGLPIKFQQITNGCAPAWHICAITLKNKNIRDEFAQYLLNKGIKTMIHYPICTHRQNAFIKYSTDDLKISESLFESIISLPMNICLERDEQDYIIDAVKSFW